MVCHYICIYIHKYICTFICVCVCACSCAWNTFVLVIRSAWPLRCLCCHPVAHFVAETFARVMSYMYGLSLNSIFFLFLFFFPFFFYLVFFFYFGRLCDSFINTSVIWCEWCAAVQRLGLLIFRVPAGTMFTEDSRPNHVPSLIVCVCVRECVCVCAAIVASFAASLVWQPLHYQLYFRTANGIEIEIVFGFQLQSIPNIYIK